MSRAPRLNLLALARRDKPFMGSFKADPGHVLVSIDLCAGEPSVVAHYTKDLNYYDAIFGMQGKRPYIANGVLKIDDIYVTNVYNFPVLRPIWEEVMRKPWPAGDWADQWVADSEIIKDSIKPQRQLAKVCVLGLSYGMGPKKLVNTLYDAGHNITLQEAQGIFKGYWKWAADVKRFADICGDIYKANGKIPNVFGYINYPEAAYKAFNAFIQSTVSGVMHWFVRDLRSKCTYFQYIATVHDELICQIPEHLVKDFRGQVLASEKALNTYLNWSVEIKTGFKVGKTMYEAK